MLFSQSVHLAFSHGFQHDRGVFCWVVIQCLPLIDVFTGGSAP